MTDDKVIRQALAMLSTLHRALIYQAYYLGHTTAQIASEYCTTECIVRSDLQDAMLELRRILRGAHAAI